MKAEAFWRHFLGPAAEACTLIEPATPQAFSHERWEASLAQYCQQRGLRFHPQHPDYLCYQASGVSFVQEELAPLLREAHRPPFEWPFKLILVPQVSWLREVHSNKLLKLLEEVPRGTLIVLVNPDRRQLLETLRSRCQVFTLAEFFVPGPAPVAPAPAEANAQEHLEQLVREVLADTAQRENASFCELQKTLDLLQQYQHNRAFHNAVKSQLHQWQQQRARVDS